MNDYYCPSCGQKNVWELEYPKGIQYCKCGMVWRPMTSAICYDVNKDVRDAIQNAIDATLQVYHVRDESINEMREHQKKRAVEYLTNELMKGPIQGGTMSEPSEDCSMFGSDIWAAMQKAVLIRDNMCSICGLKPSKEVHHIRPRHLKGKNHPRNLIGLCLDCHDEVHRRIDNGIQEICEQSLQVKVSKFQTTLDAEGARY